jgi:predicted GTPase
MYLPARVRMQNGLIHGNSGAGKSMIIEKFIRSHSLEVDRDGATPADCQHANAAASHAS